jgi:hypothetical protein
MTDNLESGKGGKAVTNDTPFPKARGLWVGGTGDVVVRFPDESTATFYNVTGFLPVEAIEVLGASTATNITAIL